jgi:hypothetical protein
MAISSEMARIWNMSLCGIKAISYRDSSLISYPIEAHSILLKRSVANQADLQCRRDKRTAFHRPCLYMSGVVNVPIAVIRIPI